MPPPRSAPFGMRRLEGRLAVRVGRGVAGHRRDARDAQRERDARARERAAVGVVDGDGQADRLRQALLADRVGGRAQRRAQLAGPAADGELERLRVAGRVGRGESDRVAPVASGRLSANVPSPAAVPPIESPVFVFRALSVDRPWVRPSSVTALRLTSAPSFGEVSRMAGWLRVEDPADERRRLGLAARTDERDVKSLMPFVSVTGMIVCAVGASGLLLDRRGRLVLQREVDAHDGSRGRRRGASRDGHGQVDQAWFVYGSRGRLDGGRLRGVGAGRRDRRRGHALRRSP